jgi:hypothetical protein
VRLTVKSQTLALALPYQRIQIHAVNSSAFMVSKLKDIRNDTYGVADVVSQPSS